MLQQAPPPTGPRKTRLSGRLTSTRAPNRGGIQKRNNNKARVDKDGDLVMDAAGANGRTTLSGRGALPQASSQTHKSSKTTSAVSRGSTRPSKAGIDPSAIQKALLRGMGSNDALLRKPRSSLKSVRGRTTIKEGLDRIMVKGLLQSKAARNSDGGASDLIAFLERKATHPEASSRDVVKIKKSLLHGDTLIISVRPEDTQKILRLHDCKFAGVDLKIEILRGEVPPLESPADSETPDTINTLRSVLSRRYDVDSKLLDLSQLGNDPELVNIGMFNTTSRESKFFPALMKICDSIFASPREKEKAIVSVSLANNALTNLATVTTLAQAFPALKNLDLSNNQLKTLSALEGWRWKFRKLDQLILSGNPIEAENPNYKDEILKWYPTLTTLNAIQIRSPDEAKAATSDKLPIPVLGASFRDEASIGENFVKQFFPAYDSDRTSLVNGFYDAHSTFSLSINVSAPRAPEHINQQSSGWESYIRRSRNLIKIESLTARMNRLFTGTEAIRDVFTTLPATRHPELIAEPQKWCIECHTIPGIPDPAGQSASGVGGLMVIVHGQFHEVDVSTSQVTTTRSFDRTFVLGPGGGVGGIRVVCDTLVLRTYGGHEAWQPDTAEVHQTIQARPIHQIPIPDGFGLPGLGKTDEQVQKEVLAVELSKATGMTLEYSGMCLEQSGWNMEGAALAYEHAKVNLPPEAFVPQ